MTTARIATLAAHAFRAAGACIALWTVLHPWDQLTGPEAARSGSWLASHTFHFLAGAFSCAALPLALGARREWFADALGRISLAVAFVGSALFTGTGVFTAFLWPTLAEHSPMLVEASGPFFSPPHTLILITGLLFTFGYVFLAIALRRQRVLSTPRAVVLGAGFLLLLVPPPPLAPVPWVTFVVAGLVAGAGLVALGGAVMRAGELRTDPHYPSA